MSRNKSNWDFLIDESGNYKTDIQKGHKGSPGTGSKGAPGAAGNDGSKGDKGEEGLLGFKGDKGEEGSFPQPTVSDEGYVLQYISGSTQWVDPNGGTF